MTFDLEKAREVSAFMQAHHHYGSERFAEALDEIERLRATIEGYEIDIASFLSDRQVSSEIIRELRAKKDENALIEAIEEQAARIKELRAELASANVELMAAGETVGAKEARIQEMEDALKEEKAWTNQYQEWLIEEVAEGMSENGFADDDLRQRARDSLLLDGKIGPDATRRSWQITDERLEALQDAINRYDVHAKSLATYTMKRRKGVLRAMLEAGQAARIEDISIKYQNALDDVKNLEEQIETFHLRRENELRQMNEISLKNKDLAAKIKDQAAKIKDQAAKIKELEIFSDLTEEDAETLLGKHDMAHFNVEKKIALCIRTMLKKAGQRDQTNSSDHFNGTTKMILTDAQLTVVMEND